MSLNLMNLSNIGDDAIIATYHAHPPYEKESLINRYGSECVKIAYGLAFSFPNRFITITVCNLNIVNSYGKTILELYNLGKSIYEPKAPNIFIDTDDINKALTNYNQRNKL